MFLGYVDACEAECVGSPMFNGIKPRSPQPISAFAMPGAGLLFSRLRLIPQACEQLSISVKTGSAQLILGKEIWVSLPGPGLSTMLNCVILAPR